MATHKSLVFPISMYFYLQQLPIDIRGKPFCCKRPGRSDHLHRLGHTNQTGNAIIQHGGTAQGSMGMSFGGSNDKRPQSHLPAVAHDTAHGKLSLQTLQVSLETVLRLVFQDDWVAKQCRAFPLVYPMTRNPNS